MASTPTELSRYTLKQRFILRFLPPVAGFLIRMWASTWRVTKPLPAQWNPHTAKEPYIYAFWHEAIVTIIPHWRDCRIQGLASQSFDGELIARAMHYLGYPALARGSSSRGGAGALKAQMDSLAQGYHVAISVDGPRGPRYAAKAGVAQLSALSGVRIVPVAAVARPNWRLRNWDKTMLPPPFARVAFVFGEPLTVAAGKEKQAVEKVNRALMAGLDEAALFLDA